MQDFMEISNIGKCGIIVLLVYTRTHMPVHILTYNVYLYTGFLNYVIDILLIGI